MTAILDPVTYEAGTGATTRHVGADAVCLLRPVVPTRLALIGGFTGATAFPAPSKVLDWTSANVIEFIWPLFVSGHSPAMGSAGLVDDVQTPLQLQLEEIKRRSGLTWGQIADAMGVEARAVHLWRRGGGISAEHEERLHELSALIDSIDLGTPEDARRELVEVALDGSLLERLRGGESPRAVMASSPWRSRARDDLQRNLAAHADGGVLDEDYVFLLYLDDVGVAEFVERATELLDDPTTSRAAWESTIDAELDRMEQPPAVVAEVEEEDERLEDEGELAPLFEPADLGIHLGVGAIAARHALTEGG
jgi:hypothetical protein